LTGLTLAAAGSLLAGGAVSGAAFYLTAGIAGAAVSAMLLVRKNPMELLQMRE
jgi:glucose dehydrogenase